VKTRSLLSSLPESCTLNNNSSETPAGGVSASLEKSSVEAAISILHHVIFAPILGRLIRAGVPDLLEGGAIHAADLASQTGLHPLATVRAMRALTALGVFREVAPSIFVNTKVSSLFRNAPGCIRNYALHVTSDQFVKTCAALGHSLETGQSAHDDALGQQCWEYLRDHPDDNVAFNRGLAEIRKDEQAAIAAAYDWTGVTSVADIGAGVGSLMASIIAANPGVRGILFDRPDVLPDTDHLLTARGVRDRCELVGGSFFEPLGVEAEVWILSQVLHDWSDAECRRILTRCRERMKFGHRLLVVEMVPVPGQPDQAIAVLDMRMLMFFGEARQRTKDEYIELFAATGFNLTRVMGTGTAFSILEASPV